MVRRRSLGSTVLALALGGVLAAPSAATPPGANGMIGWQQESRTAPPALWAANADGSAARRLLRGDAPEFEIAWSPVNPAHFAFTRVGRGAAGAELYLGDATTGAVRRLTRGRADAVAPAFSPDGTRIAYFEATPPEEGEEPTPADIYVIGTDGTGRTRLTGDSDLDSIDPDWSPDGRRIVFTEGRPGARGAFHNRLAVMDADGGARRALTPFGGRREINAKWMPDGQRVVFESMTQRSRASNIEVIGADGTGRRDLLATPAYETNPVPSPDGTRIVFTSDRDRRGRERLHPGFEVYTMAVDGTDVVRLTRNRRLDLFPDWQRLP